jgi:CubicO group peptidase (beta-lactamase class C family)
MRSLRLAAMIVLSGLVVSWLPGEDRGKPGIFPGKTWATKTARQGGMNTAGLDALKDYVGGSGCIVRHGCLIYSWGDIGKRGDIASAAKPWYILFLLKLLEEGKLKSLDEPVHLFEPRLKELNPALAFKDRKITWRQLANQTSCYGVEELPGDAYDYSDYNMALLFDTLFLKAYGTNYAKMDADVLGPKLTDVLQCEDRPTFLAFGMKDRPGRLAVSVRDLARFGLLFLREGNWNGKQVLDKKLARMAVTSPLPNSIPRTKGVKAEMIPGQRSIGGGNNQTDHLGSYSFAWWTNGVDRAGKRHWPDAPVDTYAALGHGGKRACWVIPSLNLVVAWNDSRINSRDMENAAVRLLAKAAH